MSSPFVALSVLVAALSLVGLKRPRRSPPTPERPALPPAAASLREGEPLDLNAASPEELELLPRIGPALATRIVEGRPYADREALTQVRGIGRRTVERLGDLICAGDECATASPE